MTCEEIDDCETALCLVCGDRYSTGPLGHDLSAFDAAIWDQDGVMVCDDCAEEYISEQAETHDRPYEGGARVWL